MKRYKPSNFEESSILTWEVFKEIDPDQIWNIKGAFKKYLKRDASDKEMEKFYKKYGKEFYKMRGPHQIQLTDFEVAELVREYLNKSKIPNRPGNLGGYIQD